MNASNYTFQETLCSGEIRRMQALIPSFKFDDSNDDSIHENKKFNYHIILPASDSLHTTYDETILLLHGLNERSWKKYEPWATRLANDTGMPVILFPLAFHMNRTPTSWYNPRELLHWFRQTEHRGCGNATFANTVLSTRICECPMRFYVSGKESAYNICQLMTDITTGQHPLFYKGTRVHLFAYSIGAFLSEILLLANPYHLFQDSRLFIFMGGSAISEMYGASRSIMDDEAFHLMKYYYRNTFGHDAFSAHLADDGFDNAFRLMLDADRLSDSRQEAFMQLYPRLRIVSMKKDNVIPSIGIERTLGDVAPLVHEQLDFPFAYTHQTPFPTGNLLMQAVIRDAQQIIMDYAASFFLARA